MQFWADLSQKRIIFPLFLVSALVLTACSPNAKSKFSPYIYKSSSQTALPHDSNGGITVRVKLHAGEALQVKADDYTFTSGRVTRRGSGSITLAEEGMLKPKGFFVLKSKRYFGALEAKREGGGWLYVNHVPMDEYLTSVVSHEMSPNWHPEALKAQAVVARTYLLVKMKERTAKPFDVDTTTNFQVYGGVKKGDTGARNAVGETHDEVLYHGDTLAQTFFHSSCGGTLASAQEVWGKPVPYLNVQNSPYCSAAPVYKWQVKIPFSEIARRLNARGVRNVTVAERSPSKRVKTLTIATASGVKNIRADKFRTALGAIKVKSTFFGVARKGDSVILTGRGFGHGVGMCQWGAKAQADERGNSYKRILDHYFPGTSLRRLAGYSV
ncbi:SpoIID/LytB domain-containing protein [Turneriella parva]|uniref:SpoIID/LytB domain protein n=1 Tax=Turneriella parva (strain ATCC BAA-1111 / DSM 21527 / NCTC 11395 / H) TaxID=869212 RepID=I4B0N0_TURPD|nr:SpoIID/LytB domain-containing protein [Turneriella parva]AFM10837.1 SpoIID/LytB domain protein [Turneriella parva DSM 21527]